MPLSSQTWWRCSRWKGWRQEGWGGPEGSIVTQTTLEIKEEKGEKWFGLCRTIATCKGVPCQDLYVQFCRFSQKVRLQYCGDKFSSDTLNRSLRICRFRSSFFSCPKMELKQCCLPQIQCIRRTGKNMGPSACSHSKCKRKEASCFFF